VERLLDYGALGLLALTLGGLFTFARAFAVPYLRDTLATNRELRELCQALRTGLASQGQRMARIERVLDETHGMVEDLHREHFGTQRSLTLQAREK